MVQEHFSPATATIAGLPANLLFLLIALVGIGVFAWVMARRLVPLRRAAPDARTGRIPERVAAVLKYWLAQWRHPRYMLAGVLHIIVFLGFLVLAIRSTELVLLGIFAGFRMPGLDGAVGVAYDVVKDYASTAVFVAVVILAIRRAFFKPRRYDVPETLGKDHTPEALLVLGLIAILMLSESLFEASLLAADPAVDAATVLTLTWAFETWLSGTAGSTLASIGLAAYTVHDLTFFFFLCLLPFGKHFHVITSLFNVFFMRLERGNVKPVRHGVSDEGLDDLESFGVKTFEDFTWKHMLDFYSCVDCGRCSDHCPATRVGRPLSPRFISIKARDYAFEHYPILGQTSTESPPLIGGIYSEDEIWSCTTCGACEQECPVSDRVHRQDGGPAPRHGGRGQRAPVHPEAARLAREAWQRVGQAREEARRVGGRHRQRRGREAGGEWRHRRDALFCRQRHLLRRPDAEDRAGHRPRPREGRRRLRGDRARTRRTAATTSAASARRCSSRS